MSYNNIEIVSYKAKYKPKYKTLNYEWLAKYYTIEPFDEQILSHPEREVLKKGGHIFFALRDYEIIGTCTLIKINKSEYELTKMCVTEKAQGKGVGKRLLHTAINKARHLGANKIYASTGKRLSVALHLYRKIGFREIDTETSPTKRYTRTEISLVLEINSKTETH